MSIRVKKEAVEEIDPLVLEDAFIHITAAKVILYQITPFFGSLAARLIPKAINAKESGNKTMGVMATGILHFDPNFVIKLHLQQLAACLAHEVMHLVGDVFGRCNGRDPEVWNMAHDYAINPLVQETGLKLPEGLLIDDKFKEMAAEEIYEELMKQNKSDSGKVKLRAKQGKNPVGGNGGCADHNHPDNQEYSDNGGVDPTTGKSMGMSPDDWKAAIAEAAANARMQGKFPAGLERYVGGLFEPDLDWKTILRKSVESAFQRSDYTYRRLSRRGLAAGYVLPGRKSYGFEATLAVDTSGSIGGDELKRFASEAQDIIKLVGGNVTVICCDAEVHEVVDASDISQVEFKGGGGTSFVPVFDYLAKRQQDKPCRMLIYFTDLMGTFPIEAPRDYPVIWLVPESMKGYKCDVPFGNILYCK